MRTCKVVHGTKKKFTVNLTSMAPVIMPAAITAVSPHKDKFIIQGGRPLRGTIQISGSKNAALPLIAASLLASSPVTLQRVPAIQDVATMLEIISYLGAKVTRPRRGVVVIDPKHVKSKPLPASIVGRMRASIILLGPLLARFGKVEMAYPGGCVIGRRPIFAHLDALQRLGAKVRNSDQLELSATRLKGARIVIKETSVTATEVAVIAASVAAGRTDLVLAAAEPHVQDLCRLLNKMGAKIRGIGTHSLQITGVKRLHGAAHRVVADYLELGTFAVAAALTPGSNLTLRGGDPKDLEAFWNKFEEIGADFQIKGTTVTVKYTPKLRPCSPLVTRVYPGFPTDLQTAFSLLFTQINGVGKIFETIFEGRLSYLFELEKMGARVEILNPHQAIIIGPTRLKGAAVTSCDLRAGAALVLAALAARGVTEVAHIDYIDRGYEDFALKLSRVGASIERAS